MISERYGPWALVTGASSGIGRAFAKQMASDGLNLVLSARSGTVLESLGAELREEFGIDYRVAAVDLSTEAGPQQIIDAVEGLDIGLVISNAGDGRPGPFLEQTAEAHLAQIRLNATSHMLLVRALGAKMVERDSGGIILTSASGGVHGMPFLANTAAAKGYVYHLGEALHHELKPAGIDVLVILPGNVDTPLVDRIGLSRIGIPLPLITPERAVRGSLRALRRGKVSHVPGRSVRIMQRLMPRWLSVRLNGWLMQKAMAANESNPAPAVSQDSVGRR